MDYPLASANAAGSALSDEEVVARVKAGEVLLYEVLVTRHHRRLYGLARKLLRDDTEAEDVIQDVHIRVLTHLEQFAGRSKFLTWLTRIAVNEVFARLRERRRLCSVDVCALVAPARGSDPEEAAIDSELYWVSKTVVGVLPANYRKVFALRAFDGVTTYQAAQQLGLTSGCVKTRLHRAAKLLRRKFPRPAAVTRYLRRHGNWVGNGNHGYDGTAAINACNTKDCCESIHLAAN